ncbi:Copiatype Polyprotein [Phytophthora palmivora]|uniref:Copiatype Polyprotein n=1 Tax=Phytophthora palmivora TaxID=4796 RepID=A0A2P4XYV6_9STRA|nr:Copiatype Polyprotein [Phytophthora palmivora]
MDVHHIRKFGSLAYVQVPVTSGRRKHHNNAKIGYVLGVVIMAVQESTASLVNVADSSSSTGLEEGEYDSQEDVNQSIEEQHDIERTRPLNGQDGHEVADDADDDG